MVLTIQTIRISRDITRLKASQIIRDMGYKATPQGPNNPQYKNYWSFRQRNPKDFIKSTFRTKMIMKKPEIYLIMGKLDEKKKK